MGIDFTFVVDDLKSLDDYELIAGQIRMIYNEHCCEYDYSGKSFKKDVQGIMKDYPEIYSIGVTVFWGGEGRDRGSKEAWELYDSNFVKFNTVDFG